MGEDDLNTFSRGRILARGQSARAILASSVRARSSSRNDQNQRRKYFRAKNLKIKEGKKNKIDLDDSKFEFLPKKREKFLRNWKFFYKNKLIKIFNLFLKSDQLIG